MNMYGLVVALLLMVLLGGVLAGEVPGGAGLCLGVVLGYAARTLGEV